MSTNTKVNIVLEISEAERKRIVMEYLHEKFKLGYDWKGDKITHEENCYHNDTRTVVVGKVTKNHKLAKELYDFLETSTLGVYF